MGHGFHGFREEVKTDVCINSAAFNQRARQFCCPGEGSASLRLILEVLKGHWWAVQCARGGVCVCVCVVPEQRSKENKTLLFPNGKSVGIAQN